MKRLKILIGLLAVSILAFATMALTNYPNGVASYGIPLPAGDYLTSGKYFFVNNTNAKARDAAEMGTEWDKPFRTIDFAIGRCTAGKGDIIFVAPWHQETISSAAAINLDVNGVRIVGVGTGQSRPRLTWSNGNNTASGASLYYIKVNALNTSLENMILDMSGVSPVGVGTSAGVSVYSGASGFVFAYNTVYVSSKENGKTAIPILLSGGTNTWIHDCDFQGGVSTQRAEGYAHSKVAIAQSYSGVSCVVYIGPGVYNVEIGPNVKMQALNAVEDTGLIEASSSRVSDFYLHDTVLMQQNSGASCYRLSTVGLASGVVIQKLATIYGGGSGLTSYLYWDVLGGPQVTTNK